MEGENRITAGDKNATPIDQVSGIEGGGNLRPRGVLDHPGENREAEMSNLADRNRHIESGSHSTEAKKENLGIIANASPKTKAIGHSKERENGR